MVVEMNRRCCMHCAYWNGCIVITKNETDFSCSTSYCKLFEPERVTLTDKLRANKWVIPKILHLEER